MAARRELLRGAGGFRFIPLGAHLLAHRIPDVYSADMSTIFVLIDMSCPTCR
jgi:hypothetical protein